MFSISDYTSNEQLLIKLGNLMESVYNKIWSDPDIIDGCEDIQQVSFYNDEIMSDNIANIIITKNGYK